MHGVDLVPEAELEPTVLFSVSHWLKNVSQRLRVSIPRRRRPQRQLGVAAIEVMEPRTLLTAEPIASPFNPVSPFGSLVYSNALDANFETAGESDQFTLTLDPGQSLTAIFEPQDASIQARFSIIDPFGATLTSTDAFAAGQPVMIQMAGNATPGTYTINAESLVGAGNYAIKLCLNAAVEEESLLGIANDEYTSAQEIGGSEINLSGGGRRLAVVGRTESEFGGSSDWYSFTLTAGERATLVDQGEISVSLELYDSSGIQLARGTYSGAGERIDDFPVPSTGTYFARVSGFGSQAYSLVVLSDATIEGEPNDQIDRATPLFSGVAGLGSLYRKNDHPNSSSPLPIYVAVHAGFNGQPVVDQLNQYSYFGFQAVLVAGVDIDTVEELSAYDVVVIGDDSAESELETFAPALRAWVEAGKGGVVGTGWLIRAAGSDTGEPVVDIDAIIPIDTQAQSNSVYYETVSIDDSSHPLTTGLPDFIYLNSSLEFSYGVDTNATVLATANGVPAVVVNNYGPNGNGRSVWLGLTYLGGDYGHTYGDADQLLERAVAWAGAYGGRDRTDFYRVHAAAGDNLVITTADTGVSTNLLDPAFELYASNGALVASDDNGAGDGRNAAIAYTVPAGADGNYFVRVSVVSGSGDYLVRVAGATNAPDAPLTVNYAVPGDGSGVTSFPTQIRLSFSSSLLLPELSASDLTVNGQPASSFTIYSGQNIGFNVEALAAGDGIYTVELAAGAVQDLHGQWNQAFTMSFAVDSISPVVVDSSISPSDILAPGSLTYTAHFSEDLNEYALGADDVRLVDQSTGTRYQPDSFNYSTSSDALTVHFNAVPEGVYTLTLISSDYGFRDVIGNRLNGAPSFPLPSGDGDSAADDFQVLFAVDIDTRTYPTPLVPVAPLGSLIYDQQVDGAFHAAGDQDSYTLDLDGGQTISVLLDPSDSSVVTKLELFGPGGASLGSVTGVAGAAVILQTLPVTDAGTYRIEATGIEGAGRYRVQITLNAAIEEEAYTEITNDSRATAQDLTGSFIALAGGASRGAVFSTAKVEAKTNVALGRPVTPVAGTVNGVGLDTVVDGTLLDRGTSWQDGTVWWIGTESTLEIDLGEAFVIDAARVQADYNDAYRLEYLDNSDGLWKTLWDIPYYYGESGTFSQSSIGGVIGTGGVITRPDFPINDSTEWYQLETTVTTSRVRFRAVGGDNFYAVSEIQLRGAPATVSDNDFNDFYAIDLTAGQAIGIAVNGVAGGRLALELQDAAGVPLAIGAAGVNVSSSIQPFVPATSGRYYAYVTGDADQSYSLIVTRDAEFDIEPNDSPASAMEIGQSHRVLGSLGSKFGGTGGTTGGTIRVAVHDGGQGAAVRDQLNDDTYFDFNAVSVIGSQIDTLAELNAYDVVIIADYWLENELASFAPALRAWVEAGGGVVATGWTVYAAGLSTGTPVADIDAVIPVNTQYYSNSNYAPTLQILDNTHTVTQGLSNFVLTRAESEYAQGAVDAGATILATAGGQPAVVVGAPGQGRSVYLGPTYLYRYNSNNALRSGNADRLLEQAVAWAATTDREDHYLFQANTGDSLVITTATPLDGTGEPLNDLDPVLSLYGPTGDLVVTNENGGTDERNARIEYVVPVGAGGTYRAVISVVTGRGEYTLNVSGATGTPAPFQVTNSSPSDGALLAGYPSTYRVDFSQSLLLTSIDPTDLTVDGIPATSVQIIDANTLEFSIAGTSNGDALYQVAIVGGALTSISGLPLEAFTATFDSDATSPTVVESSLAEGATIGTGDLVYHVRFSEEMATSGLGAEDVTLVDIATGYSFTPTAFSYDAATSIASITYSNLSEGEYALSLLTSATAFRDRSGNLLDGTPSSPLPSGDGNPGDNFSLHFFIDAGTRAIPSPLTPQTPIGGLIYAWSASGFVTPTGDDDVFTLNVEAGQLISVAVVPASNTLQPIVEIVSPDGTVLASDIADVGGFAASIQTLLASGEGTYKFVVRGESNTQGKFDLRVVLNAALETESLSGPDNNSLSTAQDLTPSTLSLADGVSRLAVSGTSHSDDDFYRFTLPSGAYVTLAGAPQSGSLSNLELQNATGTVLAVSSLDEAGSQQRIANFLATGGIYFARVRGGAVSKYNLVVTIGAGLDAEPNDEITHPQLLEGSLRLMGGIGGSSNFEADFSDSTGTLNLDGFTATGLWHVTDQAGGGLAGHTSPNIAYFGDDASLNFNFGNVSGTLTSSPLSLQPDVAPQLTFKYRYGGESGLTWDRAEVRVSTNNGASYNTVATKATHINQTLSWAATTVNLSAYAGQTILLQFWFASGDGIANTGLGWQIDDVVLTGVTDLQDFYQFEANAGDRLILRTQTPGDAVGEPVNNFNPVLDLYNAAGDLVATDDNSAEDGKNAVLQYTVLAAGMYRVRVRGTEGGAYQLSIDGSTATNLPVPYVSSVAPFDAQPLASAPSVIFVTFSEQIRADSVQATDLVFSTPGATVTGAELLDGKTVKFTVDVPNTDGTYQYTLAGAAFRDLQGFDSLAFSGSFAIDRTAPHVVLQTPVQQAAAPFSQLSFTFDESLKAASVSTADITSFTGPGGTNLLGQIQSVSVNGITLTVNFNNQTVEGTYTMTIGPAIEDVVGNPMSAAYTGTIELQSPDLSNISVTATSTAMFGSQITVDWLVRNIGSDPAKENWSDRVYLSRDTTLSSDDALLFSEAASANPLATSGEYAKSRLVTLPLNQSFSDGTYYILVSVDAFQQQPESSESNNVLASAALTLTIPQLPDLVVVDITAPIEALSGQAMQVSWTLKNQGTADATGTWNDYVHLSDDTVIGDGDDQFFGAFTFTGTIRPGETVTRIQSLTLPITMQGNRWVVVRTDRNNHVYEHTNEGNNSSIDDQAVNVKLSPFPNLIVTSVTAPATAFSSQQTVVEWVETNIGTGATNASIWYDLVYLSTDDVLDDQDLFMGHSRNSSYLNVGESYANSLTVTMPRGIDGQYRFIVVADGYDNVFEYLDEGDNSRVGAVTNVQLTPPPDLQVTNVNAPSQAFSGQPVNLSWTIDNLGPGKTLETFWTDSVYMSEDQVLDGGDRLLGSLGRNGKLESGVGYTTPSTPFNLPIGVFGDFYIFVRTDTYNQVFEHAFETNNIGFDAIPLRINLTPPPDLVVSSVIAPDNALANHILTVTYQVANEGASVTPNPSWLDRLYLSTDPVLSLDTDLALGTMTHYGALEPGEEYQGIIQAQLPVSISGTYYAIVVSDYNSQVFELDRTNNVLADVGPIQIDFRPPDLVVDSFTAPAVAAAGSTVLVNYVVHNVGIGDTVATSWSDYVILSSDSIRGNNDDLLLLESPHNGLVNSGGTYSGTNVLVPIPLAVASGNYHLFFVTDARDQVFESLGNGNNTSPPLPISINQLTADLQVKTINNPPATLQSGDPLTVSWTVQNFGIAAANATYWNDHVYLSADGDLGDGDDIYLGSVQRNNVLAANASYDASRTFTLPSDLQGVYHVIVHTDAEDRVVEGASEGNNTAVALQTVNISLRPAPDLQVTSVDAAATAFAGQQFNVTWTVKNFGPGVANGTWHDSFYLSLDQILDNGDTYVGYKIRPENLTLNSSYTQTASLSIPKGLAGTFYVFVRTDAGNAIDERGQELNNTGYDGLSMQVTLLPPADLVVGTIDVPINGVPGRNITIDYTVLNQGTNAAQGFWTDALYFSMDDQWDVNDLLIGRVNVQANVPGGSSYSRSLTAPAPGVNPGLYHVIVRSDILNYLPELSDANNLKASLDRVDMDAEVLVLGVPNQNNLPSGSSAFYKLQVSAGETVRFVLDSVSTDADTELYVRYGAMPSRTTFDFAANEPFLADQTLTIPADQAGTYFVLAYRRSVSGSADYSLTANLVPFSISNVTAGEVGNLGPVTVKIDGARFNASTEFELVGPTGEVLLAQQSGVDNTTRAYATFNLAFQTTGHYALRATQGNTTVLLENALNVVEGEGANILTDIEGASSLRPNRTYAFKLFYANAGDTDTAAPLILMRSRSGTPISTSNAGLASQTTLIQVLGLASDGPTTIFRPGIREGFLFYFQSLSVAQGVDVQAFPVSVQDTRIISEDDWVSLEGSVRPSGLADRDWSSFWANIRTRVGPTWGDYVGFLNRLAELMDTTGQANRDVRAMFATLYAEHPEFQASTVVSGILRDSETGLPVANVELGLFEAVPGTENTRLVGQTITDSSGFYRFPGLFVGQYHFIVGDDPANTALVTFDIDRDGVDDAQPPTLNVEVGPDITNHDLWVRRTPDLLGLQSDVNPQVVMDSSGNAHLFWVRSSRIWHARYDGTDWVDAAPLPGSFGADYSVAFSSKLIDGTTPGLIVIWAERNGADNSTELKYSVGVIGSRAAVAWSDPLRLTDNEIAEMTPTVSIDGTGKVNTVYERVDESIQDDSDLYQSQFMIQSTNLVFTTLEPYAGDINDESTSGSWQFGYSFKGGGHAGGLLGKLAKIDFKFRAGGSYTAAKDLDLKANGSLDFTAKETDKFGPGKAKGKVVTSFNYKGKWTAKGSRDDCEYYFVNASLNVDGGGEFEYEVPLEWFISKTPPVVGLPGTLLLLLLRKTKLLQVDLGFGVRLTVQGQFDWTQPDAPPVELRMPDSGKGFITLTGGLFAKAKGTLMQGWEVKAYGAITGKYQFFPTGRVDGSSGFLGVDIQSPSGYILRLRTTADDLTSFNGQGNVDPLGGDTQVELIYDPTSLIGQEVDYSDTFGSSVFADVSSDVTQDNAPSQWTAPNGQRYLLWAKNVGQDSGLVGSMIQVSTFTNGTWASPETIDGSTGYSNNPRMVFDASGQPIIVWSQGDSSAAVTEENLVAAMENSDLYYSSRVGGNWTSAIPVVAMVGADVNPTLGTAADGSVVLAWHNTDGEEQHLWASSWTGTEWATPLLVSNADVLSSPTFATLGGTLNLIWSQDINADPALTVGALYSSSLIVDSWSAPGALIPTLSSAFAASLAPNSIAGMIQTSAAPLGLKPDPKYCPCDKINERTSGTNEGCGSSVEFDEATCTRTTVYKPCIREPLDPNDIVNPEGFGEERWITAADKIPYQIRFENAAIATAPAQVVQITQTLDPDLNPSSFRLTSFGFDNQTFEIPANRAFYSTRLDLTATRGFVVDVTMGIDVAKRQAFFTMATIDPETGEQPLDADVGFLPINDATGRGEGFVSYTIRARSTVVTGTRIDAGLVDEDNDFRASIVFDTQGPILTPSVFNTLDANKPSSAVEALPSDSISNEFEVAWSGSDSDIGSGLALFDIYVSIDGGAYSPWLENTTLTNATYAGEAGHTYAFFSVATDNAGNVENDPTVADAQTITPGGTATIGNFVWHDANGDGIQNSSETGLAGVTVTLHLASDDSVVDTQVTDSAGAYEFTGLALLNQYYVEFGALPGYAFSPTGQALDPNLDSDANVVTGITPTFSVTNGENLQWDAGLFLLGSIGGTLWNDIDGDGVMDGNEGYLEGWSVYLDSNDNGAYDANINEPRVQTNANGAYTFTGLRPGMYVVSQEIPAGWEQTFPGSTGSSDANSVGFQRTYTFSGSTTELSAPSEVIVNAAFSTTDCGCHRASPTSDPAVTGGTVVIANNYHPWADAIQLDQYRADPLFVNVNGYGSAVVVIDTGIDVDHSFFGTDADGNGVADRIVYQWDFADRDGDATDRNGHGSHVSSIVGSGDSRYAGIAPGVNIIALKVFSDNGRGYFSYVEQALDWVIQHASQYNIVAINMSVGDGQNWNSPVVMHGLGDELAVLASMNVVTVAAAGNSYAIYESEGLAYPAADPNTLSVGAVWDGDRGGPWSFGSFGTDYTTGADRITSFSQRDANDLDIFAVGAVVGGANATGGVAWLRGTSMATPQVTGAVVLAQQIAEEHLGRRLSTSEIRTLMRTSGALIVDGDDENDSVRNTGLTSYRLDLHAFATAVLNYDGSLPDSDSPDVPTDDGGGATGPQAGRAYRFTVSLAAEENRTDVNFGDRIADPIAPISHVTALAPFHGEDFTVTWAGSDNADGSGLAYFDIYVSDNGGTHTLWQNHTTATSAVFTGMDGHTYAFYSVATDIAGNVEAAPAAADATTLVDVTAAVSSVDSLPAAVNTTSFTVTWSGADSSGGSGLATYDVFVSDNGGAYTTFLSGTTATSAIYSGVNGHTYAFYSVATDNAGNVEDAPAVADTVTLVDTIAASSSVSALPAAVNNTQFTLNWSGTDNSGGSGLAKYSVYVSDNGAAFTPLVTETTETSTTYTGTIGHTYRFYSVAIDNVGNIEGVPGVADATTTVVAILSVSSVASVAPNPRNAAISSINVTFSTTINAATLAIADVTLTRNGGANLLTGAQSIGFVSGNTYRVNNLSGLTGIDGTYVLTVNASGILDTFGLPGAGSVTTTWLMDTIRPNSTITPLPQRAASPTFNVVVQANDPAPSNGAIPSGLASYDIYVSTDGSAFVLWRTGSFSVGNSQTFVADGRHSYAFRSIVRDAAGNVESKSAAAIDASTFVPDLFAPDTMVSGVDSTTSNFTISLQGSDMGGGRLVGFDLYVSVDGAAAELRARINAGTPNGSGLVLASTQYQAIADGQPHSYRFYTVGIDDSGNVEAAPVAPADVLITRTFEIVPLQLTSIDVQRGETQRSLVRYLDATFTDPSPLAALVSSVQDGNSSNDRLVLKQFNLDGSGIGTLISLSGKVVVSGNKILFDFGPAGLADGYYELAIDLDGNGTMDQAKHFYRLLGDLNGDRKVDASDMPLLTSALGRKGSGLYFDLNGDGKVDQKDRVLLVSLFGRKLANGLAVDD